MTQGALEIFEQLPHEFISSKDLEVVIASGDPHTLYGLKIEREDLVQHKDPSKRFEFDKVCVHLRACCVCVRVRVCVCACVCVRVRMHPLSSH